MIQNCTPKSRLLTTIIIISVVIIACKKSPKEIKTKTETKYQLMNTGSVFNTKTNKYEPYYWINEKIYALPFSNGVSTFANGIETKDNNIYIAGNFEPINDPHLLLPCYWHNNQQINLPIETITQSFEVSSAMTIKAISNNLYILGRADLNPILWIVKADGDVETIEIEPATSCRTASNMQIYNNQIYIGGVQIREVSANQYTSQIGYWIYDFSTKKSIWNKVDDIEGIATIFSIAVSNKGVFIVGDDASVTSAGFDMWKNGSKIDFSDIEQFHLNELHIDANGDLYANVMNFRTHTPLVWKIAPSNQVESIIPYTIPFGTRGYCKSIAILENNYGYAGDYKDSRGGIHFWATANGKSFELELPDRFYAMLSRAHWIKTP